MRFGALLATVVACLSALAASQLPIAQGQALPPAPPIPPLPEGLLDEYATPIWREVTFALWVGLFQTDIEETCISPNQCPCQGDIPARFGPNPGQCSVIPTFGRCGAVSRLWWRIVFHDCGTYDASTRTGGCDGSIQFELDREENSEGFVNSINLYHKIINDTMAKPEYQGQPRPSFADVVIIAGLMSLAKCGGPIHPFTPGRRDASVANAPGMLPGVNESVNAIMNKMHRMSFDTRESVALIGAGHTMSRLRGRKLDSTPDTFDNRWFIELLNRRGSTLASDLVMLEKDDTVRFMREFANDEDAFFWATEDATEKMIWLLPRFRRSPPPPPPSPPPPPPPVRRWCGLLGLLCLG